MVKCLGYLLIPLFILVLASHPARAQSYSFTSGPIPMCDTSVFTANVSGVSQLGYDPWTGGYTFLDQICINITTNHPQTLVITLTSPQGTNLLLSAFNGAGGSNYTNTCFTDNSWLSITAGTAPFTGSWFPQSGTNINSTFSGQNPNGTWTITVIDTACAGGGTGPGGLWTPGYFNGGAAGGGIAFGYSGPPPCWNFWFPPEYIYVCPDDTVVDLTNQIWWWWGGYTINIYDLNGQPVADPTSVTPGSYYVDIYDPWDGCTANTSVDIILFSQAALGPDQNIIVCTGNSVNLNTLFPLTGFSTTWSFNGSWINNTTASNASSPGQYQVIAYNTAGCNDTAIVDIIQLPGINLGPDQNITSCGSTPLDLTSIYNTSGLTANWSLNGSSVSNPAAVSSSGTYILIATDNNGCSDTAQVIFTTTVAPVLGADTSLAICSGMDVNLLNLYNTGNFPYDWFLNGNVVSNPNSVSTPGNYMLVVTAFPGCADTAIATLSILPAPTLGPDLNIDVCTNTTLDLGSLFNTGSYNTNWTFNGNPVSNPAQVNTSGTYILVATTSGGCTDTALVLLNSLLAPVTGPDQLIDLCDGDSINLNTLYNTGGYYALWSSGGIPVANTSAVSAAGIYQLIITSQDGCSDTALVIVNVNSVPVLGPDQSVAVCSNSVIDLTSYFNTSPRYLLHQDLAPGCLRYSRKLKDPVSENKLFKLTARINIYSNICRC